MRTTVAYMLALLALLVPASAHGVPGGASQPALQVVTKARAAAAVFRARPAARPSLTARVAAATLRAPVAARPAAPGFRSAVLGAYESDLLGRINRVRAARGLRPFRVSRGLAAAAAFHSNQMGLRGFFEHESANGAPFWRRIERFYPVLPRRSWSVGENIVYGSPDISPAQALREWMDSPPHRANLLSRQWREIGLGHAHFDSAPGEFRGSPTTIVTANFGTRA